MADDVKIRMVLDDLARVGWGGGSANEACVALRRAGLGHAREAVLAAMRSGRPVEYSQEWADELAACDAEVARLSGLLGAAKRRRAEVARRRE